MTTKQNLPREAEKFLASLIGRSPATKKLYRTVISHFLEFANKKPDALGILDLQSFLQHLEEEHTYKKNTLRAYTNILRNFLRFFKREDLREQIKAIRPPKSLPMVPTPEEVEKMIEAASTQRNKIIIQLSARTGLRVGELCNLDIRDIDLQNRRLIVRSRGQWEPKGAKERVVRMDTETAALIQEYISNDRRQKRFYSHPAGYLLSDNSRQQKINTPEGVSNSQDKLQREDVYPEKLVTPQRVCISELEDALRKSWQKGTLEQLYKLIRQKSHLDRAETAEFVAKLIDEGKLAYDPKGLLVWVR